MNYFIPAFLLVSAFAGSACAANAQAPESIRDFETAYQKFCFRRGEALLPAFSKKLLSLQHQAVNQSDFEKARQIQSVLQNIKKDILSPPPATTIDPFFIGKAWKKNGDSSEFTQFLDSSLRRFSKDVKQTAFQPQNQWADPGKSSREIVVFREEAIAIHNYMKSFRSDDSPVDQVLKGIWKNQGGELYDFSNKSKAAKKNPDGSLKFYLVYTSSSPRGEWKLACVDRGTEKGMEVIFFSAGEKVYLIPNRPSRFFSVLTRVSGS